MLAATLALVGAILCDRFGLFTKAIGDRVAAVLALFAMSRFLGGTVVADWLIDRGNDIAKYVGRFAAKLLGPDPGSAIANYGIAMLVAVVAVIWIAAMVPPQLAPWAGDITSIEMQSLTIWGGAAVIVIGAALIPGDLGVLIRTITSLGVQTGGQVAGVMP
jgi:hypothetical protein